MPINNIVEFKLSKDLVEYDLAIEFMNTHINKMKKNNAKELLWFLEHNSIFTAGTSAKEVDQNIKNKKLIRYVGRGGQWTWHGPGQRVAYIMLDLKQREKDIKKYINNLEEWIILTLNFFNIDAILKKELFFFIHTPGFPFWIIESILKYFKVDIIHSSKLLIYFFISFSLCLRSSMIYTTLCPGPCQVHSPPLPTYRIKFLSLIF